MATATEPLLIGEKELGRLMGYSHNYINQLYLRGKLPPPVGYWERGMHRKWLRSEAVAWIKSGCPVDSKWKENLQRSK